MDSKTLKQKVYRQLVEGCESSTQLELLLSKPFDSHGFHDPSRTTSGSDSGSAVKLLAKILGIFDTTISDLGSVKISAPVDVAVEVSRNTSCDNSPAPAVFDGQCEDSSDSIKRLGVRKGKRGCYKRKSTAQTWTVESNTLEDTHAWRKYGQKEILNAKYPRSYYRCTHKSTCKALKQAQKLQNDPLLFQITYKGRHTCNPNCERLTKADQTSEMNMHSGNTCGSSIFSQYCDSKIVTLDTDRQINKSKLQECKISDVKEENHHGNVDEYDQKGPTLTAGDLSLVWQDFMEFEDDKELTYGYGEASVHGADMDFMVFANGDNGWLSFSTDAYCL